MALVPFAVPAALTLVLALGSDWPRDIAPGSGLKLLGLGATAVMVLVAWLVSIRGVADPRARKLSALLCSMVGLLAWPLWSMGVLPSVNGAGVQDREVVLMGLQGLEVTRQWRSPEENHWAWLVPTEGAGLSAGRYVIPEALHDRLAAEAPATVEVEAATGLLGAVVVLAIR